MEDKEENKLVDVTCQFLMQNTRTNRQMKRQAKKSDSYTRQNVQTPLSIGLPLAIHSKVRDKILIQNLSDVHIGCDYRKVLDLEKRIEQSVLHRMKDTGGFCLPDFVKKDVNIRFAIDNIDLLEDTPTGQETFHGTVIVINQEDKDGEVINEPLTIPDKLTEAPLTFQKNLLQEPIIKPHRTEIRNLCDRKAIAKDSEAISYPMISPTLGHLLPTLLLVSGIFQQTLHC